MNFLFTWHEIATFVKILEKAASIAKNITQIIG